MDKRTQKTEAIFHQDCAKHWANCARKAIELAERLEAMGHHSDAEEQLMSAMECQEQAAISYQTAYGLMTA